MSHTTEAEYKKQLEELRELHRQAVEETQKVHDQLTLAHNQKDLDDAEIAALKLRTIPVTSFNTPVPQTQIYQMRLRSRKLYLQIHQMWPRNRMHHNLSTWQRAQAQLHHHPWQRAQVHSLTYHSLIMITTNLSKSNKGKLSIQTRPRRRSDFG